MEQINLSEDLVEKCLNRRPAQVFAIRATQNHQLDQDGVDFLLYFKFRDADGVPRFFPMAFPLQVKTSDDGETVGVVLPLPEKLPEKMAGRLSRKKMIRIKKHQGKHPHISNMIFVGLLSGGRKEGEILSDIWREIKRMKDYISRNRFRYFK